PSFLYPEEEYNPEAIDENLLRGPFLLSCFRHIFTGPRTALKKSPGKSPGKKSKADLYGITKVTPENIAYAAILCRHILNSNESWATEDSGFRADIFYANIVDLFDDKEWAQDTLDWWNKWVSCRQTWNCCIQHSRRCSGMTPGSRTTRPANVVRRGLLHSQPSALHAGGMQVCETVRPH
ncbi:hypothetical protein BC826DRAFT_915268, partial [Russula brevipes]